MKFFRRKATGQDQALTFELRNGRIVDRQTESVWSFDGVAESGRLKGTELREIPGMPAFWLAWVTFYPKTDLYK